MSKILTRFFDSRFLQIATGGNSITLREVELRSSSPSLQAILIPDSTGNSQNNAQDVINQARGPPAPRKITTRERCMAPPKF